MKTIVLLFMLVVSTPTMGHDSVAIKRISKWIDQSSEKIEDALSAIKDEKGHLKETLLSELRNVIMPSVLPNMIRSSIKDMLKSGELRQLLVGTEIEELKRLTQLVNHGRRQLSFGLTDLQQERRNNRKSMAQCQIKLRTVDRKMLAFTNRFEVLERITKYLTDRHDRMDEMARRNRSSTVRSTTRNPNHTQLTRMSSTTTSPFKWDNSTWFTTTTLSRRRSGLSFVTTAGAPLSGRRNRFSTYRSITRNPNHSQMTRMPITATTRPSKFDSSTRSTTTTLSTSRSRLNFATTPSSGRRNMIQNDKMLLASSNRKGFVELDLKTSPFTMTKHPLKSNRILDVAYNPNTRQIIWTNATWEGRRNRGIYSANVNGSDTTLVKEARGVHRLALDANLNLLFYTTWHPGQAIEALNLTDGHSEIVIGPMVFDTEYLALHTKRQLILFKHEDAILQLGYDVTRTRVLLRKSGITSFTTNADTDWLYYSIQNTIMGYSFQTSLYKIMYARSHRVLRLVYFNNLLYVAQKKTKSEIINFGTYSITRIGTAHNVYWPVVCFIPK